MRTVVKSRASLLLTLVIVVFLVSARGETTPVKEPKAGITYGAIPRSQPAPRNSLHEGMREKCLLPSAFEP
ncbi:unnamed protein product, partial [Musa textilis]